MNLQDEMLEIFWVDQKNRFSNFRLRSFFVNTIVALLRGMERRKHFLEHTRKNPKLFVSFQGNIKAPEERKSAHFFFRSSPSAMGPFPLDSAACMRGC